MKNTRTAFLLLVLAGCGCTTNSIFNPSTTPQPKPTASAEPAIETPSPWNTPCQAACVRLSKLGCPEAEPTPNGETCSQLCQRMEDGGVVSLNPLCISTIDSCEEQSSCDK